MQVLSLARKVSVLPLAHMLMQAARRPPRALTELAARSWQIAPPSAVRVPPAVFLPGQLERITGWIFSGEDPRPDMLGGEARHGATRGFLLRDALLIDGVVYKRDAALHLSPRTRKLPPHLRVERTVDRGALYSSPGGHRYFGMFLIDDCVTYPLATAEGTPVTTAKPPAGHAAVYEEWLEMRPERVHAARFRELVVFEDFAQNENKRERFRGLNRKLVARVTAPPHPGVFLLRGMAGERRLLRNELEIAERLQHAHGFRVLDPLQSSVAEIVSACAGARVVAGVEGSQLAHGLMAMQPGATLLVLQPPHRFCSLYKGLTDREGQRFAFVVGRYVDGDFEIDVSEVERTLDLLEA